MKNLFITLIYSILTITLAGQETFSVDVVPIKNTIAGTGEYDADGNPQKGAEFILIGFIYPGDYFDTNCPDLLNCGILANGTAEHHDEAIGRWDFNGFTMKDLSIALANGGTPTYSTQIFAFKKNFEDCPGCVIVTEGKDFYGGSENVSFKKSISGSTTEAFRLMRGEVEQIIYKQSENENATGSYNMKVTFYFENN